jgi:hypothetical protein
MNPILCATGWRAWIAWAFVLVVAPIGIAYALVTMFRQSLREPTQN